MIQSATVIIFLLILGDAITEHFSLPVPGAALALVGLFASFTLRGEPDHGAEALFDLAAPWFPLFFVPAAEGVLAHLALLSQAWLDVTVAIVFSTALVLVITGQLAQALLTFTDKSKSDA